MSRKTAITTVVPVGRRQAHSNDNASSSSSSSSSSIVNANDTSQVLALSDQDFRQRQEMINRHHNRAIQVNSAANYVLAMRFKQLDNSFQHIAGEIDGLKDTMKGQDVHVKSLVKSVGGIQDEMQQQNEKMAELEQEVKRQMSAAEEKIRHYESLYQRQAQELQSHDERLRALVKSKTSQDFIVDVLLVAGAGALVRSPLVRLPVAVLLWFASALPLRKGLRGATLQTLRRLIVVARLLAMNWLFHSLRKKAVEFRVHSGVGNARAYVQLAKEFLVEQVYPSLRRRGVLREEAEGEQLPPTSNVTASPSKPAAGVH